ncbi:hypothetical protein [Paenibacillus tianjinensis]|nr:hypothetical protein [Paenibacillus tianjinensis]
MSRPKTYNEEKIILDDISFDIPQGSLTGLPLALNKTSISLASLT